MEAWAEVEGCEPVGIRAPEGKYELVRRITADNMAEGRYYILAKPQNVILPGELLLGPDNVIPLPAADRRAKTCTERANQ